MEVKELLNNRNLKAIRRGLTIPENACTTYVSFNFSTDDMTAPITCVAHTFTKSCMSDKIVLHTITEGMKYLSTTPVNNGNKKDRKKIINTIKDAEKEHFIYWVEDLSLTETMLRINRDFFDYYEVCIDVINRLDGDEKQQFLYGLYCINMIADYATVISKEALNVCIDAIKKVLELCNVSFVLYSNTPTSSNYSSETSDKDTIVEALLTGMVCQGIGFVNISPI